MAATILPGVSMPELAQAAGLPALLARIRSDYPDLSFTEGVRFSWQAQDRHVSYRHADANTDHDSWALLHEVGHALLGHSGYRYDIELLQMEATAWQKARALASTYGLAIDEDYIQDCLDTYRDWLHLRATCPACFGRSLQATERRYHCFNCQTEWQVSRSRLCRPYRLQTT
jgi:hypothetical protein